MNDSSQSNFPKHVAIIMDGNGRWAKSKGKTRIEGHGRGVETAEEIITYARELNLSFLTLYAFSKENFNRPASEVAALMQLLSHFLISKEQKMLDQSIRLNAIGNLETLPEEVTQTLKTVMKHTANGRAMVLTLALGYGGRDEILRAVLKIINARMQGSTSTINEQDFAQYLDTVGIPEPDLIIRTSGEHRISNFLLWQGAYAEYHFEDCYWPDFTQQHFLKALEEYQKRERRFGLTSEQLLRSL